MAGSREKAWSKKKKFREGQKEQTLDDLFFEFIKLTDRLKPRVVVAENVKGMIQGNARAYVNEINKQFSKIGYRVQLFLLNAASMGVPQKRERVFFVCSRKELNFPKLDLSFNEVGILAKSLSLNLINKRLVTSSNERHTLAGRLPHHDSNKTTPYTLTGTGNVVDYCEDVKLNVGFINPKKFNKTELCKIGSYPLDYNFKKVKPQYLIGMSVPPVMTAQIAHQIYLQWFKNKL